jgi:hypothetical protein
LFLYAGFALGTMLCAMAQNYHVLLLGRIVTHCLAARSAHQRDRARPSMARRDHDWLNH